MPPPHRSRAHVNAVPSMTCGLPALVWATLGFFDLHTVSLMFSAGYSRDKIHVLGLYFAGLRRKEGKHILCDRSDAYFHIPVHPEPREFLHFAF